MGTYGPALSADEAETLETLSVQDVFLRCLESSAVDEADRQALTDCFNEIVSGLEDAESCA
jgi:hypothetical protein